MRRVTVSVTCPDGTALIEAADDGVGGVDVTNGSRLRRLADGVAALEGNLRVESPPGVGTVVSAAIPVRLAERGRQAA